MIYVAGQVELPARPRQGQAKLGLGQDMLQLYA